MAKAPKGSLSTASMALLTAIVNAEAASQTYFIAKNPDSEALVNHNPKLVEVNTSMVDPTDPTKVAARATEAGKTLLANASAAGNGSVASAQPSAEASSFAILSGVELPQAKKRGGGGGAPTKYPFEQLEVGQSFFVPGADKVKKLQSTVSSANQRFAEKTGEKEVTRTKRGPGNKALIGADGQKVQETVSVPVWKYTRRFTIRPVKAGVAYGTWTPQEDGAIIARTQ